VPAKSETYLKLSDLVNINPNDVYDEKMISELKSLFERQLTNLAHELDYNLASVELELYLTKLGQFGLRRFAEACLEFRVSDYPKGVFPSIDEFERIIRRAALIR
jgi:hypothetical protein